MDPIEEEVAAQVARIAKVPRDKLTLDADLRVDHKIDSLAGLRIVAALEKKFGIQFSDEELGTLVTIRTIAAEIRKRQAAAAQ
jgi:acyl carrier protein